MAWIALIGWSFSIVLAIAWIAERRKNARLALHAEDAAREARASAHPTGVIAHEIRTPLALIKGAGELLEEEAWGGDGVRREELQLVTQHAGLEIRGGEGGRDLALRGCVEREDRAEGDATSHRMKAAGDFVGLVRGKERSLMHCSVAGPIP